MGRLSGASIAAITAVTTLVCVAGIVAAVVFLFVVPRVNKAATCAYHAALRAPACLPETALKCVAPGATGESMEQCVSDEVSSCMHKRFTQDVVFATMRDCQREFPNDARATEMCILRTLADVAAPCCGRAVAERCIVDAKNVSSDVLRRCIHDSIPSCLDAVSREITKCV